MKRALFAVLCVALIVSVPGIARGSAGGILSQLRGIERQTRSTRQLDEAEREKIEQRVRDLTQRFYEMPKRDPKQSAEFGRLSGSIWENLREQSVGVSMRGLSGSPTARDEEFERQLEAIEARCRNLPKPVSGSRSLASPNAEVVRQLRDDVLRFAREYPAALRQYQADVRLVRLYKPESRPGAYKLKQARTLLEGRALEQLREAPRKSRELLASRAVEWLEDAKSDLLKESRMEPSMPGIMPMGGVDPIIAEVFPDWRPGDPYPLAISAWSPNDDGQQSKYDELKRLVEQRHDARMLRFGTHVNETLESAWNVARLGAAFDQVLGGDPTVWQPTIEEAEKILRARNVKPTDHLAAPQPSRD